MKRLALVLLAGVAAFVGLVGAALLGFIYFTSPPREARLLDNFYAHRAAFEELREMLQEDEQISRLGEWGVHTVGGERPVGISKPPEGDFPVERFRRYLSLLKEAHAIGASRGHGPHPRLNVLVWRSGFAGDSKHINMSWQTEPPELQVSSLDDYHRPSDTAVGKTDWVCRHIDSHWYLCTDMWSW